MRKISIMTSKVLMLILFLTLASCEKDLYEDGIKNQEEMIVKTINLKTYSKTPQDLISFQRKMERKKSLRAEGKLAYDSINNFYYDDENVKYIQAGIKESYTIGIQKEGVEKLQNILFDKQTDGTYKIYLVKYDVTPDEFRAMTKEEVAQLTPEYIDIEFDNNGVLTERGQYVVCVYVWEQQLVPAHQGDLTGDASYVSVLVMSFCEVIGSGVPSYNEGGGGTAYPSGQGHSGSGGSGPGGGDGNNTGGLYGNGSTYTIPVIPIKSIAQIKKNFYNNYLSTPQQKNWWNLSTNSAMVNLLSTYLFDNQIPAVDTPNPNTFIVWAVNYNLSHPNITPEKFENWFMTPREGIDGTYDQNYWEDPSLTFPQQNLPTFADFDAAYPRQTGSVLIGIIGGDVQQAYINNPNNVRGFCALKVSKGLNDSGITIPNLPGKTIQGGDGNYYFLNAKALNAWMRLTFGVSPTNPNHLHITNSQAGINGENLPTLTANIKGIYSLVSSNPNWASGHADLLNADGTCIFGCHFSDAPIDYIDIWILN